MDSVQLVISANGCTDNTRAYLTYLATAIPHLDICWSDAPLGFAKATNEGIKKSIGDKVILLNNDTVLLNQSKNDWLNRLSAPHIGTVLTQYSPITQRQFGIFFCTSIDRKVIDAIGLLDEDFGTGGCEDIDYCYRAEQAGFNIFNCGGNGTFPIYHKAEGTMHDPQLVQNWDNKFRANELKLSKKYNLDHYRFLLSNNYERAVFLKGDPVFPRERQRYEWANQHLYGQTLFELGCTTGYGRQFFPDSIQYTGIDYDPTIIEVAKDQRWDGVNQFVAGDINAYDVAQFDTIVAFEVIEHLNNGLEIVKKLKDHCKVLLISVPWNEPKGFWGEHHKLHGLNESHFPGFEFQYISHNGQLTDVPQEITPDNPSNLMLCKYSAQ
jgi:GT2 family glycosyltransferase